VFAAPAGPFPFLTSSFQHLANVLRVIYK
jgi:hypothetical protein